MAIATARVAGWTGHIAEQRYSGRLIRPIGSYLGTVPGDTARDSSLEHPMSMWLPCRACLALWLGLWGPAELW